MKLSGYFVLYLLIFLNSDLFSQNTVDFTVTVSDTLRPISPYIYGTNSLLTEEENWTAVRQGGNRMTGYNWENNASHAGRDWYHYNDNYLTWVSGIQDEEEPGIVTTTFHDKSLLLNAYSLVTLQLAGYVSRDKNGTVQESQTAPSSRWNKLEFVKGTAYSLQPDISDTIVYIDEYVNFLADRYGPANSSTGIKGYSLDNEPALWSETHPRIHPVKVTCTELVQKGIQVSLAAKNIDPDCEIFGPVLFGFSAYTNLQSAADWNTVRSGKNYDWFIDYYLDEMKKGETSEGKRLLDVLDLHWYPEAIGDMRITEPDANSEADKIARVQAPRTLWDENYIENSWIGQWGQAHLPLIPKIKESIDEYYPGTKLAFTEFTYGGENDISGAIAVADVLGIFGKYNLYFASFWPVNGPSTYISSSYKIFRNYDGSNSAFGDLYLPSSTSDIINSSVYGSIKEEENEIHLVVINKNFNEMITGNFSIESPKEVLSGRVWKLDGSSSVISETDPVADIAGNLFTYSLPAASVLHFVLETSAVVEVADERNNIPDQFSLQVYPNPFNPSCKIEYTAPGSSVSRIDIISVNGELVKTFSNLTGSGRITWNGTNRYNQQISNGVYLAVLRDNSRILSTQKLILLK